MSTGSRRACGRSSRSGSPALRDARSRIASTRAACRLTSCASAAARAAGFGTGSEAASSSARANSSDVERIDEHPGGPGHELGRAADARRDHVPPARERLEDRLAERLEQRRPADDVGRRQPAAAPRRAGPGRRLARSARPSRRLRSGPSPTNVSDPRPTAANASASRTTFLRSVSEPTQTNAGCASSLGRDGVREAGRGRRPSRRPRSSRALRAASPPARAAGSRRPRSRSTHAARRAASGRRRPVPHRCSERRGRAR